jgi:hypothetical protein
MTPETKDKITTNVSNSWKMASNWAMSLTGAMFAVYLALPLDQQQAVVTHLPVPAWVLPIITSVIGIVARLWPQKSLNTDSADLGTTPKEP